MPLYLVERYLARDDSDAVHTEVRGLEDTVNGTFDTRLLWCVLAAADATVFCLFDAPDEAAVIDASRRTGFRFDRMSPVSCLVDGVTGGGPTTT